VAAITSFGRVVPGSARTRLVALLGALTVALGGVAAWSAAKEGDLTGAASARNGALSDNGRTSEVKGQITTAVNTVFSYNYADVAKTERAAREVLTGKAVEQYARLFALVREQAPQQKQVLTTTVTDSAVRSLTGGRARLLVFADQRNTRTDKNQTSYSAAVFAVDAVRVGGEWKIGNIDTLTG
jgi:Mce-associated membrane protein